MKIDILQLLDGAREARGVTVIIDVFRAFSTACYAFGSGARVIYPTGSIEEAFSLKRTFPDALLAGERNERKPEGFDLGNSPTHLLQTNVRDRKIIHTTSSGTQGIVNAVNATEILTGSFVNAAAIVRYIKKVKPSKVSLVCMGYACRYPTDEDTFCAEYIRNELTGRPSDRAGMINRIRNGSGARFFEESGQSWAPASDFDLCMQWNIFNFVLRGNHEGDILFLEKTEV